ncbi:hypothetical protein LTS14_002007 [Recurvomyces mirabilis]|uniref:uncharacterized protein n=1 Tax=Recurvomyces mirabilis TaxID=574656 RepID=UPI002DE157C9|nr:hypothetical protein LTS14_002007 [Recurvomyces mirabilis]
MSSRYHINQRLSLKGQACTIRFTGLVKGKSGDWIGVEWDDPTRGKHEGSHGGTSYFSCRGDSPACASFLRPNQPWDEPRTFLEALREKYVERADVGGDAIYFSSKQAEEVGFEKFANRQAKLEGIKVLVLNRTRIQHSASDPDVDTIADVCAEITDLDIGGNLFESIHGVVDLCRRLPRLRKLVLDGNRMVIDDDFLDQERNPAFVRISELSLSNTFLDWENELHPMVQRHFVSIRSLNFSDNECGHFVPFDEPLGLDISTLDLSNNEAENIENISGLSNANVHTLILKNNRIDSIGDTVPLASIVELDVRHNAIASFDFIDMLPTAFPALRHLRTTGNPLYSNLRSHDGKPLTTEDGYMLTIARLPQLKTLNYKKERLNAETYYLNTVAQEVSKTSSEEEKEKTIARHPRWKELCEEYGEPAILRQTIDHTTTSGEKLVDPNSLAARLVTVNFTYGSKTWTREVPKSFSVYEVLGLVGRPLSVMPLKLRLIYETNEQAVLVEGVQYEGPGWWCSDGESEGEDLIENGAKALRAVELVAGTRTLGTYVEGRHAKIRVELR